MCSRAVTTAAETLNIVAVRRSIISRNLYTRTNWIDNYIDRCTYTRQIPINARISNTNEPRSECPTFLKVAPKPCDQKVFD
eukprot:COSAG01_NODE_600_length_14996_cov_385.219434_15_plen_81_part_00